MSRTIRSKEFARNYGFWSEAEQHALVEARVAIAGAGGGGFQLGLKLARMGVGAFAVADPEVFEPENVNRVEGAAGSTMGRNKAEVFRDRILDINPDAVVDVYTEGVTPENVAAFLRGATVALDESESTMPQIGTMIARAARAEGIPVVMAMNVGFAAQVTSFAASGPWTFERFHGVPAGASLDDVAGMALDLSRTLPYIPPYTDLRSLVSVQSGVAGDVPVPLPSLSVGVDVLSAIASTQVFLHITAGAGTRRRRPVWAPRVAYVDAYDFRSRIVRAGRPTHYRHLLVMALRHRLGRNPQASYDVEDIARRLG